MTARLAVGLIGCGFFARNHLFAWRELAGEGVDLVAVCDVDRAKAERAAAEFGVEHVFTDAAEMMNSVPLGLVDICTTMPTHRPLVELAMSKRIPAIVQKPFGPTIADCRAMAEAAAAANTFLAVHENFRFQAPLLKLREIIDQGTIGTPTWARIGFRTGWDIYTGQPYLRNEERFILLDIGVHVLDIARFFLGEVDHLSAELQHRNPEVRGEDTATMLCRHKDGAVSVVDASYSSYRVPDPFPETLIEIEGPDGVLTLKPNYVIELSVNGERTILDGEPAVLPWAEKPWHVVQDSVLNTCRHMVEALRAGRPAATSAEDNLHTFALVEAAYEADRRARGPAQ